MSPRDMIRLTGLEVFAYHGVLAEEREHLQPFLIDLELLVDLTTAAGSDDLADTIDYGQLALDIQRVVADER
ncbi:MAG: dihydroneopterin aldolase, partial [Actinomycetota bacterium]